MLAASNKRIDKYLGRTGGGGYTKMLFVWTLDKPMASLSTCHLIVLPWMAILLNIVILYGTALFEQLINIARYIEMWI